MLVHPGHVGLFEDTVQFSVIRMQGISNYLFGADGHHLVTMTGPGQHLAAEHADPGARGCARPRYMAHDDHGGAATPWRAARSAGSSATCSAGESDGP